jgi:hypothetical protein
MKICEGWKKSRWKKVDEIPQLDDNVDEFDVSVTEDTLVNWFITFNNILTEKNSSKKLFYNLNKNTRWKKIVNKAGPKKIRVGQNSFLLFYSLNSLLNTELIMDLLINN